MRRPRIPLNQLLALLRSRRGRKGLLEGVVQEAWPLVGGLARICRGTLGPNVPVVTVVGSFGKSTTTAAIRHVMGIKSPVLPSRNSYSALAFQLYLSDRRQPAIVLEVGIDGPGQMQKYADMIRPSVTVMTSIGSEHHRSLGSLDATCHEKGMMVRALPTDGVAFLNGDDPYCRSMARLSRGRSVTYGFDKTNQVRAESPQIDWPGGLRFLLHLGDRQIRIQSRLVGMKQLYSLLAAAAVGFEFGADPDIIAARLETFEALEGRMQRTLLSSGAYLLRDDAKSSLETVESAIEVLKGIPARRRMVVLGDISEPPGSQGPIYREIGRRLAGTVDQCFVITSQPQAYIAGARQVNAADRFTGCSDVIEAAELVNDRSGPGDVILIKGRDTQRMERVGLMLQGRHVKCRLKFCGLNAFGCSECPML